MSGQALQILGTIGGSAAGADFLPGLAGKLGMDFITPAIGGALGGAAGGGITGGGKGALEGALGGYFGGPTLGGGLDKLVSGIGGSGGAGAITASSGADALVGSVGSDPLISGATTAPFTSAGMSAGAISGAVGDAAGDAALSSAPKIATDLVSSTITPTAAMVPAGPLSSAVSPPTISSVAGPSLASRVTSGGVLDKVLPAALLTAALTRKQTPPELGAINDLAKSSQAQGDQLSRAVTPQILDELQGKLPAAAQSSITAQVESEKASIRARYAEMGLQGSTMEGQDLAAADQRGVSQSFVTAQNLAQAGLSVLSQAGTDSSQAATLYGDVLREQTQQGQDLGDALALLTASMVK